MTLNNNEQAFLNYLSEEQFESALSLIDSDPSLLYSDNKEVLSGISFILILANELDECITFCLHQLKSKPSADLFYNLACAYELKNNILEAIRFFQCARMYTMDLIVRNDVQRKILNLRYPELSEAEIQQFELFYLQQKMYIIEQLKEPQKILNPKEFITTSAPRTSVSKPRILYGTMEIANHIAHYLQYFRTRDFDVFGVNYYPSYLNYDCDFSFNIIALSPNEAMNHYALNAADLICEYDVFHFLFNRTLLPQSTDLIPLKQLNKTVFMHNLGSDIRIPEIAFKHHDYWKYAESYLKQLNSEVIKHNITLFSKWIDHCIVNDHEMLSYVKNDYKHIHMIGLPIDLTKYTYVVPAIRNTLHIVHAPTNPEVKGSCFFEHAIHNLSKKYSIKYTRVEKMDHKEALEIFKNADIICDQLIIGTYGSLAVECMAMGKCIATFINPNFQPAHNEEIPMWALNIDNIESRLEELIASSTLRQSLSQKARAYVEKNNDLDKIGAQLLALYQTQSD